LRTISCIKLEHSPQLGEHLGGRAGLDLTGYYKLHAARKLARIVYRIVASEVLVEVIGIGRRENPQVYRDAILRLRRRPGRTTP
jgi:mRNA interferase RelE/StbE